MTLPAPHAANVRARERRLFPALPPARLISAPSSGQRGLVLHFLSPRRTLGPGRVLMSVVRFSLSLRATPSHTPPVGKLPSPNYLYKY